MHPTPTPADTIGRQLKAARRLLKVSQHQLATAIDRPFRAVLRAEGDVPSGADTARLLRDLYERNGVVFGTDGRVSLKEGAFPGLNVAMAPRTILTGDCNGRDYQVEVQDGEITGIWMRVTETFGNRAGTSYWMPLYGFDRPRRAERRLTPVIEETHAALERAAAAATR